MDSWTIVPCSLTDHSSLQPTPCPTIQHANLEEPGVDRVSPHQPTLPITYLPNSPPSSPTDPPLVSLVSPPTPNQITHQSRKSEAGAKSLQYPTNKSPSSHYLFLNHPFHHLIFWQLESVFARGCLPCCICSTFFLFVSA